MDDATFMTSQQRVAASQEHEVWKCFTVTHRTSLVRVLVTRRRHAQWISGLIEHRNEIRVGAIGYTWLDVSSLSGCNYLVVLDSRGPVAIQNVHVYLGWKPVRKHNCILMLHERGPTFLKLVRLVGQTPVLDVSLLALDGDRANWSRVIERSDQEGIGFAGEARGDWSYRYTSYDVFLYCCKCVFRLCVVLMLLLPSCWTMDSSTIS